ncbi:MAG: MBL fold metallo-hydrolase [Bacteroidia bacterium]|nr:MBL fold metallo-hydrolase [Bacteroidia bacterium]
MSILKISDRIFQVKLKYVNAFILLEDNGLTIVDTGYSGSFKTLLKGIDQLGFSGKNVNRIIVTHCHPDHTGELHQAKVYFNAPVFMHTNDAELVEEGRAGRVPYVVTPGIINRLVYLTKIQRVPINIAPTPVEEKLNSGDEISLLGGIYIVHTPGHSLGHISLLFKEEGILIAGDICANVMKLGLSPVNEDPEIAIQSIYKVTQFDFHKACFGHGKPIWEDARRKLKEQFLR